MTAQAETETFFDQAARARDAARVLATLTRARKDAALLAMADALAEAEGALLEANARDVAAARESGTSDALIDRLTLTPARIAGMVTRRGKPASHFVAFENATVDLRSALVMHRSGDEEQLSAGQIALLRLFLANPRKVLSRDEIIATAPAENMDAYDRSIDSRIVRLRRKLDTESIVTIRGSGYRFDPPAGWPD